MVDADISTSVNNLAEHLRLAQKMSHSSIVLASAAILDSQLERCIKRAMKPHSKALYRKLFESSDAPLYNFASKIVMARALDIVSTETYIELEKIRAMRNKFAHSITVLNFESKEIAPIFLSLKKPVMTSKNPAVVFTACLISINNVLKSYGARAVEEGLT